MPKTIEVSGINRVSIDSQIVGSSIRPSIDSQDKILGEINMMDELAEFDTENDLEEIGDQSLPSQSLGISKVNRNLIVNSEKLGTIPQDSSLKIDQRGLFDSLIQRSGIKNKTPEQLMNECDQAFESYIAKVEITEDDWFRGCPTILTGEEKALRRCCEISAEIVSKMSKTALGGFVENTIKKDLFNKEGSIGTSKENIENRKWVDPDFGATPQDESGAKSLYYNDPPPGYVHPMDIKWCKLTEISPDLHPVFVDSGSCVNDVSQGEIGDCWFIGAMSVIATQPELLFGKQPDIQTIKDGNVDFDNISDKEMEGMLMGVYPPMFIPFRMFGIYVFKFFKNYDWRYVIIDDTLPCRTTSWAPPTLVFAKCSTPNEFWAPLIEKAYAKLHGNYESLISGYIDDGLMDMTGYVSSKLKLQDPKGGVSKDVGGSADALWETLMKYNKNKSMMGCSIIGSGVEHQVMKNGEDTGLLAGHAYSLNGLFFFWQK